jgi:hypothetical protein
MEKRDTSSLFQFHKSELLVEHESANPAAHHSKLRRHAVASRPQPFVAF